MVLYPVACLMLCLADKTTELIITECQNSIYCMCSLLISTDLEYGFLHEQNSSLVVVFEEECIFIWTEKIVSLRRI